MPSATTLRQPTRRFRLLSAGSERVLDFGFVGVRCRIDLTLVTEGGQPPVSLPFVADTGASYSMISLRLAEQYGLSMDLFGPDSEVRTTTTQGFTSIRVRPGRIRAWWTEERIGYHFDWPVLFRIDAPLGVPSILGLGGIVKTCEWTINGSYAIDSAYGYLTLTDIR